MPVFARRKCHRKSLAETTCTLRVKDLCERRVGWRGVQAARRGGQRSGQGEKGRNPSGDVWSWQLPGPSAQNFSGHPSQPLIFVSRGWIGSSGRRVCRCILGRPTGLPAGLTGRPFRMLLHQSGVSLETQIQSLIRHVVASDVAHSQEVQRRNLRTMHVLGRQCCARAQRTRLHSLGAFDANACAACTTRLLVVQECVRTTANTHFNSANVAFDDG